LSEINSGVLDSLIANKYIGYKVCLSCYLNKENPEEGSSLAHDAHE